MEVTSPSKPFHIHFIMNASITYILTLITLLSSFQASGAPTVKVAGLMVVRETYMAAADPEAKSQSEFFRKLDVFQSDPGVKLALMVQLDEGFIIDLDEKASGLKVWKDDTGAVFTKDESRPLNSSDSTHHGIKSHIDVSNDKKVAMVELGAHQPPAEGATQLIAEGTIGLKVASGKKTSSSGTIKVKKGESFEIAGDKFVIDKISPYGKGIQLTLDCKSKTFDPLIVVGFSFKDSSGKVVAARKTGHSIFNLGLIKKKNVSVKIEEPVTEGTLEVIVWDNIKTVSVPVSIAPTIAPDIPEKAGETTAEKPAEKVVKKPTAAEKTKGKKPAPPKKKPKNKKNAGKNPKKK